MSLSVYIFSLRLLVIMLVKHFSSCLFIWTKKSVNKTNVLLLFYNLPCSTFNFERNIASSVYKTLVFINLKFFKS